MLGEKIPVSDGIQTLFMSFWALCTVFLVYFTITKQYRIADAYSHTGRLLSLPL